MAKVMLIFEDTPDGTVTLSTWFDPPVEDLPEDSEGRVEMTPAMVLADTAYSAASKTDPVACACGGECPCK